MGYLGKSLARRIRRAPSTAAQSLCGECLVLDLKSGIYYTLGEIGGFIWEQLDSQQQLVAIVPKIVDRFEIDVDTAAKDLIEFVEELLENRLTELM